MVWSQIHSPGGWRWTDPRRAFAMEAHQKAMTKTHLHMGRVEVPKRDDGELHVKPVAYLYASFP